MPYLSPTSKPSNTLFADTLTFWSEHTSKHISILLSIAEGTGAVLFYDFKKSLLELRETFNQLHTQLLTQKDNSLSKTLAPKFLTANKHFITILERLKFEGFNGYPILIELIYHFILEASYAQKVLSYRGYQSPACSTPFTTTLNLPFKSTLHAISTHLYIFSLCSAQHTSVILNISPLEILLPESTRHLLQTQKNEFNGINFDISQAYDSLTSAILSKQVHSFTELNTKFCDLLSDFKCPSSTLFPEPIKAQLPPVFFDILFHFVDEHTYIANVCSDFNCFLNL